MLSHAYNAGIARALHNLGMAKNAALDDFTPNWSDDMFEAAAQRPLASAGDLGAPKIPAAGKGMAAHSNKLMQAARKNPLLTAGLAIGGAAGLGMGAHSLLSGRNLAPQPRVTYNYSGPANPLL